MLPAAFLALTLTAPGQVSADAARVAQMLAHRSALEYDLGHAEDALRDIEHAYLLDPLPGLLFNLGQCHRKLKHWEQAREAYQSYLRYRPNAPNRDRVEGLIEEMKREEAVAAVPELGAGRPLPVPREPEAPAPSVPALHGEPRSLLPAEAVPVSPAPAAAPVAAAPPAAAPAPPAAIAPPPEAETSVEKPSHSHLLSGVLFGAAAVSAGFAIYGAARVANWQSEAGNVVSGTTSYGTYEGLQNQIPNMGNWELAASILGGAALAGVIAGIFAW